MQFINVTLLITYNHLGLPFSPFRTNLETPKH